MEIYDQHFTKLVFYYTYKLKYYEYTTTNRKSDFKRLIEEQRLLQYWM